MRRLSLWLVLGLTGALPAAAVPLLPNDILVTGTGMVGEGLIRIDRDTGSQTLISPGSYGDFQIVGPSVYALSGNSVVVIDTDSGSIDTFASGDLIDTIGLVTGLAVIDSGDVFVASDAGIIVRIDATSHQQSIHVSRAELDAAFGPPNPGSAPIRDLEIDPGGSPISLANYSAINSWVGEVSSSPGQMTLLFDARDLPFHSVWGVAATGLGIAPDGLIVASDGGPNTVGIAGYDPATDVASLIGGTVIGLPDDSAIELILTDVAIDGQDVRWIVGNAAASPIDGLFRNWRAEVDGTAFSPGIFNEIQIVPIPEPASGTLALVGLVLLAAAKRGGRR
jgi:hypothetical protein